jgi:hypothetical protein
MVSNGEIKSHRRQEQPTQQQRATMASAIFGVAQGNKKIPHPKNLAGTGLNQ